MYFNKTPLEITSQIDALCRELVSDPQPEFLEVTPAPGANMNDCFKVVKHQVQERGGSVCHGWQIWEWPGVMVQAEFHGVWRNPEGSLRDLTPKEIPVQQILFLPDPMREYDTDIR